MSVPSMNVPKFSHTMTSVGSYILVTGGYNVVVDNTGQTNVKQLDTVEIFDGLVWIKLPYTLSSERENSCAVPLSETEILVVGGTFDSTTLLTEKYNIFTGEITNIPSSSVDRFGHACALLNGEVYVSGGTALTTELLLDSVEVLNLKTLEWRTISPMNTQRADHTMEIVNGELTVFGGFGTTGVGFNTIEKLMGTTWRTQTKTLRYPRGNHASAVVDCD